MMEQAITRVLEWMSTWKKIEGFVKRTAFMSFRAKMSWAQVWTNGQWDDFKEKRKRSFVRALVIGIDEKENE